MASRKLAPVRGRYRVRKKTYEGIALHALLILCSVVMLIPIYLIVIGSFKSAGEANTFSMALPTTWRFQNYVDVWNTAAIVTGFKNGVIYAGGSTVVLAVIASMAAFVITRSARAWKRSFFGVFVAGLLLPPNYIVTVFILQHLQLYGTYAGMIFSYVAGGLPFAIFVYCGFMKGLSRELDEAAIIDGCSSLQLFARVIFPLLTPATFTVGLLNAVSVWNDFVSPLYYTGSSSMWSMPISIYNFFSIYAADWNLVFADLVYTAVPMVILFLIFQRYIVSGMTAGAIKA